MAESKEVGGRFNLKVSLKNPEKVFELSGQGLRQKQSELSISKEKFSIQFIVEQEIEILQRCKVMRVKGCQQSKSLVVKITPEFENEDSHFLHQQQQVQLLQKLVQIPSPNIIKIQQLFFYQKELFCFMEYACGGDLGSYIKKNSFMMSKEQKIKKFSWVQKVVREILIGIESVHKLGFVYRDLKPSNVLIDHKGNIQLCDFGLAITHGIVDESLCGTPQYMAPQRLLTKKKNIPVSFEIDMWSLGIVTYELLMGQTPYPFENNIKKLVDEIFNGYLNFDDSFPECSLNFIMNLLEPNPKKRLTLDQAKNHQFLQAQVHDEELVEKWWKCKCQH